MHAMFHFWRVIGYCLGIEDRFNLCAGTDEEIIEKCRFMFWSKYHPAIIAAPEKTGIEMTKGITYSMQRITFLLDYNALLRYMAPFMNVDKERYPLDKFRYV